MVGRLSNLPGGHDLSGGDSPVRRAIAPAPGVLLRRAQRAEVHQSLQLILGSNGRPPAEEHIVDFLRFCVYRSIDLSDLWVATDPGGRIVWAILPVVSPGRTMLLFSPTYVPPDTKDTHARPLVERVLAEYRDRAVDLAQVLLDPAESAALRVFAECGFETLAELIYLDRDVRRRSTSEDSLPAGFSWDTHSATTHSDFARVVGMTYEGSLDCPRLNGKRDIDDVLAGHKSAGEFDPKLWFLLRDANRDPVGVLLLNRSTRTDALELVYLGLAPSHRGRGLGDVLMRHAQASAAQVGSRRLSLAVDSRNLPALALYRRHGMARVCSRMALMRDLRSGK
jgi:mycothiol synthase